MNELLARVSQPLSALFGPGSLELAHPEALLLLPLPLLVWWLLPPYRERQESVHVPFFEGTAAAARVTPEHGAVVLRRNALQWLVAPVVWLSLLVALARPEWVEPPLERIESARDLLLAVDLSGSMEARDFTDSDGNRVDRLQAVKLVLDDFIQRREGDRLGLVVFGDGAHLQVPFTLEHDTCRELLAETRIGMAGPRTVIGDAIGLAIRLLEDSQAEHKVVVLLTDGADTGSRVPPAKAAEIAARRGITVHAIGMGDPETTGEDAVDVDELRGIAAATGGRFFLAADTQQLEGVYRELDAIEQQEISSLSYRPRRPLYQWPAGLAVLAVFAYHAAMALIGLARGQRVRHA